MGGYWQSLRRWFDRRPLPAPPVEPTPVLPVGRLSISSNAQMQAAYKPEPKVDPFARYRPAPGVLPVPVNVAGRERQVAFDYALPPMSSLSQWALQGAYSEGITFLGYPYLAELAQRAEYRRIAELWAEHSTRKWIKLRGPDDDRLGLIDAEMKRLQVRETFRHAIYTDGVFGRAQIFLDMQKPREVDKVLPAREQLVAPSKPLKALRVVEPMWSYPGTYEATDPTLPDFYRPQHWYVNSRTIHADRLVTIIGKPVADLLKPGYAFGGLSRLQMAKPYVDNWLQTRESTSDLLSAFSQMVLATDLSTLLGGGDGGDVLARVDVFNRTRDNRGTMVIDKGTEELTNVVTPLAGLADLQAASQEQMASVAGIPLSIYLQITPQGLNASSENEIRSFYADVKGYQEASVRPGVQRVLELVQLSLDGRIDPDVGFEFESLWEMSDVDRATVRKTDADRDAVLVDLGAITNDEVRERMADDESGPYHGLTGVAPEVDTTDNTDDDKDSTNTE